MNLTGNAYRLDVLASRLPVSFQRWLGMCFLLIGIGLLAIIDAVWLPRLLFSYSSNHSTIENKAFAPEGAAKHIKAAIHPISAAQQPNTPSLDFSTPKLPPLIFSKSTTWLSSDSQETLANVRAFLEANPTARVVFSGHTDDQGTDHINNSLSLERAQEAHDWLVLHGIDPSRIHTQGFGSANPLLPNHSEEARARNRRVEISFR